MSESITNKDRLYGNIIVYSMEMQPMFITNLRRAKWYLNFETDKLAEIVEYDNDSNISAIKLLFKPNGLGYYGKVNNDDYHIAHKENICVVTGNDNWKILTKHHVVPYMYRKWFPMEYKSRNCHDIVLISKEKHYEYEKIANLLKDDIARELNLPTLAEYSRIITRKSAYIGMAKAILNPDVLFENKIDLCIKFRNKTGFVPTAENLNEYIKSVKSQNRLDEFYGKMIFEKLNDYQGFVERWRKHFIDTMNPEFMPKGWDVKRNIYV